MRGESNMLNNISEIATIIGTLVSIASLIVTLFISNNVKKMINNSNLKNVHDKNVSQNINGNKNKTNVTIG